MSSQGYATPLRLESGALPLLQRLYLLFSVLVVAVLVGLPVPLWLSAAAIALFLFAAYRVWRLRSELGGAAVALVWDAEQRWWWQQAGREHELELQGSSYLSTWLVILNWRERDSGKSFALVLSPASIGDDTFRRLLVRFRIERDPLGQATG